MNIKHIIISGIRIPNTKFIVLGKHKTEVVGLSCEIRESLLRWGIYAQRKSNTPVLWTN